MKLRLSHLAREDMADIHDYTVAKWGVEQAANYVSAIWDALEEICGAPERWRQRPDIYPGCRACVCGSHLIIYRLQNDAIEVSRVLHGARNLRRHVPGDFMGDTK